jgi:hypothetical protein
MGTRKVQAFYDAVAAGAVGDALALLGEHVDWYEAPGMPYERARPYQGAQEVAEHVLGPINEDVEGLQLKVSAILDLGGNVAAIGRYTGTARTSGRPVDQPFVHVWSVDSAGTLSEFRQYTDADAFKDALRA